LAVYAAAHVLSGSPPQPEVKYQIDYSTDAGKTWQSPVKDWTISRRGDEPGDFWSQSLCWGKADLADSGPSAGRVRFRNSGGKKYARGEVHLVYRTRGDDATRVTFDWTDSEGPHRAAHRFASCRGRTEPMGWTVPTGKQVRTRWVEYQPDY
jgi:Neuraminidase (sialidase)